MGRIIQGLVGLLPRRRRRLWRYVSPRRRGVGVFALALLLVLAYTYWILTNDGRIRRQAQEYLSSLTGLRVKIGEAQFSLFGPIRLRNVRVYMQGAMSRDPFFRAETVMLRHNPWSLLTRGTLHPSEIVCIEPVVTFEQDESGQDRGRERLMSMVAQSRREPKAALRGPLPEIRLRRGKWQAVEVARRGPPSAGQAGRAVADMPVNLSMIPRGNDSYVIEFTEPLTGQEAPTQGKVVLNLRTGEWSVDGYAPSLPRLQPLLPAKYRTWLDKYAIDSSFHIRGRAGVPGAKEPVFEVKLENLSMALPPQEGGVKLVGVSGTIVFREDKVQLEKIAGRPEHAPDTRLILSGEYRGYEPTSGLEIALTIENLLFPSNLKASGELGKAIWWIQREYDPQGGVDLSIRYERGDGQPMEFSGWCKPRTGLAGTYRWFKYPLKEVAGTLVFTPELARLANLDLAGAYRWLPYPPIDMTGDVTWEPQLDTLVDLSGRHGENRFDIKGWVQNMSVGYDVTVRSKQARFDPAIRDALPEHYAEAWGTVNPGGLTDARVRVARMSHQRPERVELELTMDGQASMVYRHFPYPLEEIVGHVRLEGDTLRIDRLVGRRGQMRCTIGGTVTALGTRRPNVDIFIEASDLPLDRALQSAVGPQAAAALASLRATGRAERASVQVHQADGKPLEYNVRAQMRDVSLYPQALPYRLTEGTGTLTITPERTIIKDLFGRHGDTSVTINGSTFLRKEGVGLDLDVTGKSVRFDEALYAAVPPEAKEIWRSLNLAGVANLNLALRSNMPDLPPGKVDYRLDLQPVAMAIKQENFPYPFGGITGRVIVTPELVDIKELTSSSGSMWAQVSGTVRSGQGGTLVELKAKARNVPVDDTLLKALPEELAPLVQRVKTGGTCGADFDRLAFLYRTGARGRAASGDGGSDTRPASGQATPPSPPPSPAAGADEPGDAQEGLGAASRPTTRTAGGTWQAAGQLRVKGVTADLGAGYKELTGALTGLGDMDPEGLHIKADVALDSMALGSRKLTDLKGQITKSRQSPLIRVVDVLAKVHGGRLSGFARAKAGEPMEYALSACVENVDLSELLNAGVKDPKDRLDIRGRLTGDIKLLGKADLPESLQGIGSFRISEGKLYKLPVLLGALNVVLLSLPGDSAFTEGYFSYRIRGQKLILDQIHLTGPALSIFGSGTMNMKTEAVRLTFLMAHPTKLPRVQTPPDKLLDLADELLKVLIKEIVEIEVSGTLKRPVMRTVPLRSVNSAITRLMNPEQGTE